MVLKSRACPRSVSTCSTSSDVPSIATSLLISEAMAAVQRSCTPQSRSIGSMLETVGAIGLLIEEVGVDRVLFGSHAPFFYFESAALKIEESALDGPRRLAVLSGNARKLVNIS